MNWLWLLSACLLVFLARDAMLLAGAGAAARTRLWTAWATVQLATFIGLAWGAEAVSREHAQSLIRERWLWMPSVAIHTALWATFRKMRSGGRPAEAGAWAALFPTPMFLAAAGALVWLVLAQTSLLGGWSAGLAAGLVWIAAVLGVAAWRPGVRTGAAALPFAAASNLCALLLLPVEQPESGASGAGTQPVDWLATVTPLAVTASLVLLSFLFHRRRSARQA